MSTAIPAPSTRCSNCGATLDFERLKDEILRCSYCGNDHRVRSATPESDLAISSERQINSVVSSFLFAPLLGFTTVVAAREFIWSPYEAWPLMILGAAFLIFGLLSIRVPAAAGLALVGTAALLKPVLFPIIRPAHIPYDAPELALTPPTGSALGLTAESSLYYLVSGLLMLVASYVFFMSLKEHKGSIILKALRPRPLIAALSIAGAIGAHFFIGQTWAQLARAHRAELEELVTLTRSACDGSLNEKLHAPVRSVPTHTTNAPSGEVANTLFASCSLLSKPYPELWEVHPKGLRQLQYFRAPLAQLPFGGEVYKGANPAQTRAYEELASYEYLVVYDEGGDRVLLVKKSSKTIVRRFSYPDFAPNRDRSQLLTELERLPFDQR
ncbi:MAG: hypothetical protein JKY56_11340 [Kofleriaceae bacterium]|nr:hypothetical protein [Kofleriaceae bacterium]